jgi:hypothetical protein
MFRFGSTPIIIIVVVIMVIILIIIINIIIIIRKAKMLSCSCASPLACRLSSHGCELRL